MSSKPILPFVETMITQSCNISCLGCTNYSDLKHSGYVSWADGKQQIEAWLDRIEIPDFGIMGGEPLINPEVKDWVLGTRELLPNSQIRFTTNGLLLAKHYDIIDLMSFVGNCVFKITVHCNTEELENLIDQIKSSYNWETVIEHGITRFKTNNNFRFQINRPTRFIKTYKNAYNNMMPYNSDPTDAFNNCCQQTCPLLYNGRIYKCSTAGLLGETLKRFNNPNWDTWKHYVVDGITATCSDELLNQFIENFGNPHSICGQCPVEKQGVIIHLENIGQKNAQTYF
jgi:organic radical activating enzyme